MVKLVANYEESHSHISYQMLKGFFLFFNNTNTTIKKQCVACTENSPSHCLVADLNSRHATETDELKTNLSKRNDPQSLCGLKLNYTRI